MGPAVGPSPGLPLQAPRPVDSFLAHLVVDAAVRHGASPGTNDDGTAALAKEAYRRLIA